MTSNRDKERRYISTHSPKEKEESYSCDAPIRYLIIVRLATISLIIKRRASPTVFLAFAHSTLPRFASLRDLRAFSSIAVVPTPFLPPPRHPPHPPVSMTLCFLTVHRSRLFTYIEFKDVRSKNVSIYAHFLHKKLRLGKKKNH